MKKIVRNLFAVIAATALVGSIVSCADSDAEDPFAPVSTNSNAASGSGDGKDGGDAGSQTEQYDTLEVNSIAGKETSWSDDDFLKIGTDYTSKLTVGSKIYFDVAKNGEYLKFHVDNGTWGACGVTEYFNEDGSKVSGIEEDSENKGVFNMEGEGGVYYVEVTSANIDKLTAGFAIHGNLVINKVTLKIKKAVAPQDGNTESKAEGSATSGQEASGNGGNSGAATVVKTLNLTVNHYDNADHGIQYTEDMSAIPVDAKNGDVWTLKIAGTADAEFRGDMQFVNANWAGITGESISKTFTTTAFSYEIDFTFSADCSDGKFMLGNAGLTPAVAKTLKLTEYSFTKKSSGSPSQNSGNSNVVYSGTNVTLTIPVNTYNGSSNNQLYKSISEMGITNFSPAAGEKYTIYMKGTSTGGKDNINAMNVGFTCDYSWVNCAMDGGFNISSDSIAAGVSKEVTFKGDINASTLSFWLYNESTANESDFEEVTLTLSEFKITKVTE